MERRYASVGLPWVHRRIGCWVSSYRVSGSATLANNRNEMERLGKTIAQTTGVNIVKHIS